MVRPGNRVMLALLGAMLACAGCVQREIHIDSDPPGALVHLNDQEVGRTPVTVPFTFYGVYDVRLQREGYTPLWTQRRARAPWWDHPGPDLVAEAIPGLRSDEHWHFELEPAEPVERIDEDALLERAGQLRQRTGDEDEDDAAENDRQSPDEPTGEPTETDAG